MICAQFRQDGGHATPYVNAKAVIVGTLEKGKEELLVTGKEISRFIYWRGGCRVFSLSQDHFLATLVCLGTFGRESFVQFLKYQTPLHGHVSELQRRVKGPLILCVDPFLGKYP
jgi:hypothetical protein